MTRNILNKIIFQRHPYYSYSCYHSLSTLCHIGNRRNDPANEFSVDVIHGKALKNGSVNQLHVSNHLLNLYVKSFDLVTAHKMFDEIAGRDVRSWTILISGFARTGSYKLALSLFKRMQREGIDPNQFTFSSALKCCSALKELQMGKAIHGLVLCNGIDLDVLLENSLLDFYVKCGEFDYAKAFFELINEKDTVSWNIMMSGYLRIGDMENSLHLFERLPVKDVASWNTIIDGHFRNGSERVALDLLYQMVMFGPAFSRVTFSIALVLASSLKILKLGRQIHGQVLRAGYHYDGFVRNSLIDMYSKCGQMEKASLIFHKLPQSVERTGYCKSSCDESLAESVSWSSLVTGYVQNGNLEDALKLFRNMVRLGVEMDKFTLTSIVSASANSGLLELGQLIHAHILKIGLKTDVHLGSSMIAMYAKCGKLDDAWSVFSQTNNPNIVLWTSMISSYAFHGQGREAIWLFELMRNEGFTPNEVTFLGVLTACSHAGMLGEGSYYFRLMKEVYGIYPQDEHFTCMVDLFGRAGRLDEIKDFIHKNNISHLSAVWRAFLSSCRVHKNVETARWVSGKLLELEPSAPESYILLSNTCAIDKRWDEAANLRGLMQKRGVKKEPGQSWIRLKGKVYTFVMGDRSHPEEAEIYLYLDRLIGRLKEIGYSPDVDLVMQDVEEEQKEVLLGFHSEKLAISYGLISTSCGTTIRVMKNLRVCSDCHNFIKYTSYLLNREIVVRDIRRFHHFKNGHCSCGNYW